MKTSIKLGYLNLLMYKWCMHCLIALSWSPHFKSHAKKKIGKATQNVDTALATFGHCNCSICTATRWHLLQWLKDAGDWQNKRWLFAALTQVLFTTWLYPRKEWMRLSNSRYQCQIKVLKPFRQVSMAAHFYPNYANFAMKLNRS